MTTSRQEALWVVDDVLQDVLAEVLVGALITILTNILVILGLSLFINRRTNKILKAIELLSQQ